MKLQRFYEDHALILTQVDELRRLIRLGVTAEADAISQTLNGISSLIKVHLKVEDEQVYPALMQSDDPQVVALANKYQQDMGQLLNVYRQFATDYATAKRIGAEPEAFRRDANAVFQALFERIKAENEVLYPAAAQALKPTA